MTTGRGRGFKRESTVTGGLLTPTTSFALAARSTLTPKRDESIDLTSIDDFEDTPHISTEFSHRHHGLPTGDRFTSQHLRSMSASGPPCHISQVEDPQTDTMSANASAGGEGLRVLGHDVNRLVSLIDKLRRIGLKSIDGALPELVLIGDQSAGKSSLMGAIAEINLPKKAAMCTRCPFNIKTSPSSEWECTVSLQEDHVYEPTARRGQPPKWQPREGMTNRLFKTIYHKAELEEVLSWAQIALLNPSKDLESFVPGTPEQAAKKEQGDESIEAQYSPNVIAVEIRGPGLPALSFYDLPGLFQDAGTTDLQFLVKVFDDLTLKYIKHESAIIICTLTMANDAALSKTKRLIRLHKAEKKCVGVLTMPDRMQGEASKHADYDGIFRGNSYVLPRGYYVTKQPGPDCRLDRTADNYHILARQEEEVFFDKSPHWGPGGDWSEFRDRCGTGTIQKYLSKEFARQILRSLPDLTFKIEEQTRQTDAELANLPETPKYQVYSIVSDRLSEFSAEVGKILEGTSNHSTFHSDWAILCGQFNRAIELMRPGCVCSHPSDKARDIITIDDSDTESIVSQPPSQVPSGSFRRPREDEDVPPNKRPRINDAPIPVNFSTPPERGSRFKQENGRMMAPILSPTVRKLKDDEIGVFRQVYLDRGQKAMPLADLRMTIQRCAPLGIPNVVSPKVYSIFALQAIHFWEEPLETFLSRAFSMLRDQVLSTLRSALQQHQHTGLYRQSIAHIEELLATHEEEQRKASYEIYTKEKSHLFTINTEAFNRHKAEAYAILKKARHDQRVQNYFEAHYRSKPNADPEKEKRDRETFRKNVTDEMLGSDAFEREIEVAAYIRGYYTTARFRFTDSVCADMHYRFSHTHFKNIHHFLKNKLGLDQGDREAKCQILLEGSPDIAQHRSNLRHRKAQLLEFSKTLNELKNETFADEDSSRSIADQDDASSVTTVLELEPQNSQLFLNGFRR